LHSQGHSLPTDHSLTSRDVRNCSKAELRWCCGKFSTERVGETVPAGGRRHELGDSFRSLLANSLRTEATFLPDHAGKALDRKSVLRGRLAFAATPDVGRFRTEADTNRLARPAAAVANDPEESLARLLKPDSVTFCDSPVPEAQSVTDKRHTYS